MKFTTLLLGASMMLGTAANAAITIATLRFIGATLNNGGTASGSFTYAYDLVSNRLLGENPLDYDGVPNLPNSPYTGQVSIAPDIIGPPGDSTWRLNKPGFTSNVTRVEAFSDHDPYRLQFIADGPAGRHGAITYFTRLGTAAQLPTYGSFHAPGFAANFQTTGAGVGTLGNDAVPKPSSWIMLIAGFGLIGAARRRQRSAVVAA